MYFAWTFTKKLHGTNGLGQLKVRVLWDPVDKTHPSCMTGSRVLFRTSPSQFPGLQDITMPPYYIKTNRRLQITSPVVTVAMSGIVHFLSMDFSRASSTRVITFQSGPTLKSFS